MECFVAYGSLCLGLRVFLCHLGSQGDEERLQQFSARALGQPVVERAGVANQIERIDSICQGSPIASSGFSPVERLNG